MKTTAQFIAEKVLNARRTMKRRKITIVDLAAASGVHHQTLYGIFTRGATPTPAVLDRITEALAKKESPK